MKDVCRSYVVRIEQWEEGCLSEVAECRAHGEDFGTAIGKCVVHHLIDDGAADIPCPMPLLTQVVTMLLVGQHFEHEELAILQQVLRTRDEAENIAITGGIANLVKGLERGLEQARARMGRDPRAEGEAAGGNLEPAE